MKPAKCPFYPDSCTVEFHPNMQHVWRAMPKKVVEAVEREIEYAMRRLEKPVRHTVPSGPELVTNVRATNSERAQAWNKANRKQYNARQKILMAGKRAKRGG